MISASRLEVFDSSLAPETPLAYEIVGGHPPRTVHGVVRTDSGGVALDLRPGVYEVRLLHPTAGRLVKVLDVSSSQQTVYFRDMKEPASERRALTQPRGDDREVGPLRRLGQLVKGAVMGFGLSGMLADAPTYDDEDSAGRQAEGEPADLPEATFWREKNGWDWALLSDQASVVRKSLGAWVLHGPIPGDVAHLVYRDQSVAVRLPPRTDRVEVAIDRQGKLTARPRIENARAESMLDYVMGGYVNEAKTVREDAHALELLEREHQSPAGAVIGAYYLLRTGEALEYAGWLEELASNFSWLPDASIVFAQALLRIGGQNPATRLQARGALLHAIAAGVPVYREGVRLLRAGLDWVQTGAEGKDAEITDAIAKLRPYQAAMRYDTAAASWSCDKTPAPVGPIWSSAAGSS